MEVVEHDVVVLADMVDGEVIDEVVELSDVVDLDVSRCSG